MEDKIGSLRAPLTTLILGDYVVFQLWKTPRAWPPFFSRCRGTTIIGELANSVDRRRQETTMREFSSLLTNPVNTK
jgi:hypothetical protein